MNWRVKAIWNRFARTRAWRAWLRYGRCRGNRLAGATTFFAFLSLFPLIVLTAAVTGRLLDDRAVGDLKDAIGENLPGIGDRIDIDSLIANAGSIGLISSAVLLFTGLGWIDALRASIRTMHELDDQPGTVVRRKLGDLGALLGLGATGLFATASNSLLRNLSERVVDWLDVDGTWLATWGLDAVGLVLGTLSGGLLFWYLQSGLPRVVLPRRVAVTVALTGGVLFVGAQELGSLYVNRVIGSNQAYGALALPLALLLWIYLLTRAIMLLAAWAKEAAVDREQALGRDRSVPELPAPARTAHPLARLSQRDADTVAVAAGVLLGATATMLTVATTRAVRTVLSETWRHPHGRRRVSRGETTAAVATRPRPAAPGGRRTPRPAGR